LIHQPVGRFAFRLRAEIGGLVIQKRSDTDFAEDVAFGDHGAADAHGDAVQRFSVRGGQKNNDRK
jgi:hypothetical protein